MKQSRFRHQILSFWCFYHWILWLLCLLQHSMLHNKWSPGGGGYFWIEWLVVEVDCHCYYKQENTVKPDVSNQRKCHTQMVTYKSLDPLLVSMFYSCNMEMSQEKSKAMHMQFVCVCVGGGYVKEGYYGIYASRKLSNFSFCTTQECANVIYLLLYAKRSLIGG